MLWLWHWPSSYTSEWTSFKSLNKCTSGVPRLFWRGNPDLEPEPENSTNLTERSCLYRLVEPLTIKTVKNDPIVNNDKQCIPMSSQVSNLFLPKLPCTRLQSVIEMMFVSCMCLFFLPLVPGPWRGSIREHHQAQGGYVTYIGRNSTGSTRHQKGGAANDSTTL